MGKPRFGGKAFMSARRDATLGDNLAEMARKRLEEEKFLKIDGLKDYVPLPAAIKLHSTLLHRTFVKGSNQSGKTTACLADLAMHLRGNHPYHHWDGTPVAYMVGVLGLNQWGLVWNDPLFVASGVGKFPNSPMIPADEIADLGRDRLANGKEVYRYVKMKNGNEMFIFPGDNPHAWERFQGAKFGGFYLDEDFGDIPLLGEILARTWKMRTYGQKHNMPWLGFVRWSATQTKGSPALNQFIEACERGADSSEIINFHTSDNPYVKSEVKNLDAMFMGEEQAAIRIDGTESALKQKLIYGQHWDDKVHLLTPDYVPRIDDNLIVGLDPGWDHPAGMGVAALSSNRHHQQLIFVKLWKHRRVKLWDLLYLLAEWLEGRKLTALIVDPADTRKTDRISGSSLRQQIEEVLEYYGVKDHRTGGRVYARYGRNRHAQTIPMVQRYLKDPARPWEEPKLLFNGSELAGGPLIRHEVMNYRHRDATRFQGIHGKAGDDHLLDMVRYVVSQEPEWRDLGPNMRRSYLIPKPPGVVTPLSEQQARIEKQAQAAHQVIMKRLSRRKAFKHFL